MSLSTSTIWEARSTATAAMVNGGGFNPNNATPGTDYSQQNAAQYTFSDLASSNGTSSTPSVTSASHSFVAADCGNIIHINSGTNWTAGWYEIVSVSGGAAILDRACGSSASLSSGTYHVGGAMALDSTIGTWLNATQAGNKIWIKAGTYTLDGAGLNWNGSQATSTNWEEIEGYNSTRGDAPTGANRPTITGTSNINPGTNTTWKNIIFAMTGSNALTPQGASYFTNCKFVQSGTTAGVSAFTAAAYTMVSNSEFISYRGVGLSTNRWGVSAYNNYFHDSDIGIKNTATSGNDEQAYVGNVFDSMVTAAIQTTTTTTESELIVNNTFFGGITNKTGVGISIASGGTHFVILSNIFYGYSTAISSGDSSQGGNGQAIYLDYNDFFNNGTDVTNVVKGLKDISVNPGFSNVAQVTGTAGTTSSGVLTDNSANFSNVTNGVDFCYIISGTGITAGQYLITAHTGTSLTLSPSPANNATANTTYQVTTGRNFGTGNALVGKAMGFVPSTQSTSQLSTGSIQNPGYANTDPGQSNVKHGVSYSFNGASETGTYTGADLWTDPGPSNVLNGVTYTANGVVETGSLISTDPGTANVKHGVNYQINSVSETGTYRGSDLWTDPGSTNVSQGVTYLANGVSETGSLDSVTNVIQSATLQGQSLNATLVQT